MLLIFCLHLQIMGTPTNETWPGVENLPNYSAGKAPSLSLPYSSQIKQCLWTFCIIVLCAQTSDIGGGVGLVVIRDRLENSLLPTLLGSLPEVVCGSLKIHISSDNSF